MKRREMLALGAAAGLTVVGGSARAAAVMISGPLAGSLYFTRDNPGIWVSEVERHLPQIETAAATGGTTSVTIKTPHPMEGCKHYIIKHKLLDARLRMLSQKTFDPARSQPISRHVLPSNYRGPIYAVSICNLHDAWIEGVMIAGGALAPSP